MGSSRQVIIIGAGFAGLSAACYLAKEGHSVHVIEKNEQAGGRAGVIREHGYCFDMGPSWYWMPEVFEGFFNDFGKQVSDFYTLQLLDPSYQIIWKDGIQQIPYGIEQLMLLFDKYEQGAGLQLERFLHQARKKYEISMKEFVNKPSHSFREYINASMVQASLHIDLFNSVKSHVRKYFKHPRLLQLVEFPILFLGALPANTPSLYTLMNHADMGLGTYYPKGGMNEIVKAMIAVAKGLGVEFSYNEEVLKIYTDNKLVSGVKTIKRDLNCDLLIGAADYAHMDQHLLDKDDRMYSGRYWDKRDLAPSCYLFYLGINKRIEGLLHHNLFFDEDFDEHAKLLYSHPDHIDRPLLYVCCPSATDDTVAPVGHENLFVLIPVAAGLMDNEAIREKYFRFALDKIEEKFKTPLQDAVVYKKCFATNDFISRYHSLKGNAYGLANTLMQTGPLKPKMKNRNLKNLFYAGQLTVPGPGVPPSIISGAIAARESLKFLNSLS